MTKPIALPDIDQKTLDALPGLQTIDLILPDSNGLLRGKRIERQALEKVYAEGVCLPGSLFGADISGDTAETTGLGFTIGDRDQICRPIPGTLKPVPWQKRPTAQLLLTMIDDSSGQPFDANPREVLRKVLDRLHRRGLRPVVAVELEFFLLSRETEAGTGAPQPAINPITGKPENTTQVYYMEDLDTYVDFVDAVHAACVAQGVPADTAVAEYAPGQFEINLKHTDDPLRACDDGLMLKRIIKAVAQQQGMMATFMAKPFPGASGNGTHIHVSLLDEQGKNVFAGTEQAIPPLFLNAVAGLQQTMSPFMLMFAPHANSYRRFQIDAFVPLSPCWGFNNRTVALRVPAGDAENMRIEHRVAGADANPYLVVAAVLAGIEHGITKQLTPTERIQGNAYEQEKPSNPRFWKDAIALFKDSALVTDYFGASFQHIFTALKETELEMFNKAVSPLEYQWYLRSV